MLGNTLPLNKYIISHIKRFCNKNFTQSDSSNRSLCIMSKRKEAKCNCPQPVILKIGNYPSVKNYSNAEKYASPEKAYYMRYLKIIYSNIHGRKRE